MKPGGVSKKTGKPYGPFLACNQKNQDGSYCSYKPPRGSTPSQQFNIGLEKSTAEGNMMKKDNTISRLAIAKEFIARGAKWDLETVREMENFLAWCEGRKPHVPVPNNEVDMVPVDEIPF